jgi:hypothetical protein
MKKGALLFALNNSEIEYTKLAVYCAKQIHKHLNIPVSLVTDSNSAAQIQDRSVFDQIIEIENEKYIQKRFNNGNDLHAKTLWKNSHRNDSFKLTPYDETLVVDVDVVINSNILLHSWEQPHDFLIYRKSFDLAPWRDNSEFTTISDYSIPFYWATTFWFRKTENVSYLFELVDHIKENWQYYKFLYQIHSHTFRNDYAFSIAIHMMNGFVDGDFAKRLPGKMYYTLDIDYFIKQQENSLYFLIQKENSTDYIPLKIDNIDIHVMNKYSLLKVIENE